LYTLRSFVLPRQIFDTHRINKALFDFKPNALEPGIQRHEKAFIFDLDRFEPSRVTRYRLSIAYLVDPQPIKG
jgi:hypothetical protein